MELRESFMNSPVIYCGAIHVEGSINIQPKILSKKKSPGGDFQTI